MTVVQRTPDVSIGIRMRRVAAAAAPAPAGQVTPPVEYGAPYWHAAQEWLGASAPVTHLEIMDYGFNPPTYMYQVGVWSAVVAGATDVQWDVSFTPVITLSPNEADPWTGMYEAWRGSPISLSAPPTPWPSSPYLPFLAPIPETIAVGDRLLTVEEYWRGFETWRWEIFGPDNESIVCPTVFFANGAFVMCTNGRCMSGEIVATASHQGQELGQVTMTILAINVIPPEVG